jgi:hypothetical protein
MDNKKPVNAGHYWYHQRPWCFAFLIPVCPDPDDTIKLFKALTARRIIACNQAANIHTSHKSGVGTGG